MAAPLARFRTDPFSWHAPGSVAGWLSPLTESLLLRLLVKKEIRVRYQGSLLGMLWSYVKPATQFAVYFVALGLFLGLSRGMPQYAVYLFSGIVVVNLFSEIFGNTTRSIRANSDLVRKIYLPTELFPYSSVWVALIHFVPQVVVLLTAGVAVVLFGDAAWTGPEILTSLAAFAVGTVILVLFTLGLGMIGGALNAAFQDVENFADLIIMVATWFSPVLYQMNMVRDALSGMGWLVLLYELNPVTIAVELYHLAFWQPVISVEHDTGGNPGLWPVGLAIAVATFVVGNLVFARLKRRFAQEL